MNKMIDSYNDKNLPFIDEMESIKHKYQVSPDGVVTRICDGKIIKQNKDRKGYLRLRLSNRNFTRNPDGKKTYKVHRLVAMFYLSDYSQHLQVNHKNGIKTDNRVENLEMVDAHTNVLHGWRELNSKRRKELLEKRRDPITGKFTRWKRDQ